MKTRIPGMPGPVAHLLCIITCLVMTALLTLMGIAFPAARLLTDRSLHLSVAQQDAVLDAQYARIGDKVDALAAQIPFEPKTAMDHVTRQDLATYNAQVVDWWMGLFRENPELTAPAYTAEGLLEDVKADETFRAGVPETSWTATARDKVIKGVEDIVTQAVTPLRLSLVSLGISQALARVDAPALTGYLPYLPWALLAASLLLAGLMALFTHKRMIRGVLYIGTACAASGLCLGALLGTFAWLDLPARMTDFSALLALQLQLLLSKLAIPFGLTALALFVLGLVLIGCHQRRMRRIRLSVLEGSSYEA